MVFKFKHIRSTEILLQFKKNKLKTICKAFFGILRLQETSQFYYKLIRNIFSQKEDVFILDEE